jgi:hypothetical protein
MRVGGVHMTRALSEFLQNMQWILLGYMALQNEILWDYLIAETLVDAKKKREVLPCNLKYGRGIYSRYVRERLRTVILCEPCPVFNTIE